MEKIFFKLAKRNPKQMYIIGKNIEEVLQKPQHYKNLRTPLQNLKAVHVDKSFVLTFSVDEELKIVIFEDYDHHDKVYLK